jgi:monofunctional biosynthetic peptidoglycan transglycosylase
MVKKILLWCARLAGLCVAVSLFLVVCGRFLPIPATPLMLIRLVEGAVQGKWVGIEKTWTPIEEISPAIQRAVIASEDARFLAHGGVDWEAVQEARKRNARMERLAAQGKIKRKRLYGASTISMQTAKNAFLAPSRTYLRKALEVYFTYLIEWIWGKRRILEVYLNIIEMGDGVYGVEAAARRYFGKSAAQLNATEASLIAAVLPNPRIWSPAKPSAYIQRKAAVIRSRSVGVALPE